MMKFVIFCKDDYTGGPFALLQLNSALNSLGYKSEVLFYEIANGKVSEGNMSISFEYEKQPRLAVEGLSYQMCDSLNRNDILVFPEVATQVAQKLKILGFEQQVIWWLSWTNASPGDINRFDIYSNLRKSVNIFQSHYAQIEARRFGLTGPIVSDYTLYNKDKISENHEKDNDICFLPRKAPGTEQIIEELRGIFSIIKIEHMTQLEVQETLRRSKFFIDFGSHPGKDRLPREAALYDCVPVVRGAGAALFMEDVYISDLLKLDCEVMSDAQLLSSHLVFLKENTQSVLNSLMPYKGRVQREYGVFLSQISDFTSLYFGK